jgi:hypothetical protein
MPTLNGSYAGARLKPPQLPLRRRMTVQPPHGDLGANAQRLQRSVTIQPPHGDMDARPPRLLPWCTAETAPAPPPKTCDCPASSHGDIDAHAQRLPPWFTVSVPSQLPRSKPPLAKRTPPLLREINRPPRWSRQSRCVAPAPHPPRVHLHLHTTPNIHRERNDIVTLIIHG